MPKKLICTPYIRKNGKVIRPKTTKVFCFYIDEDEKKPAKTD